jgi:hypothetical protein
VVCPDTGIGSAADLRGRKPKTSMQNRICKFIIVLLLKVM